MLRGSSAILIVAEHRVQELLLPESARRGDTTEKDLNDGQSEDCWEGVGSSNEGLKFHRL